MIDDGELDWKVIAISSEDALANELHDIDDVEKKLPGVVSGLKFFYILLIIFINTIILINCKNNK